MGGWAGGRADGWVCVKPLAVFTVTSCCLSKHFGGRAAERSQSPRSIRKELNMKSEQLLQAQHQVKELERRSRICACCPFAVRMQSMEKACRRALAQRDTAHRAAMHRQSWDHTNEVNKIREQLRCALS
eukprot:2869709-Pleurochrysis_carterae.AAC.1